MSDLHHRSPGFKTPPHLQVQKIRMESMQPRQLHSRAAGLTRAAAAPHRRQVSRDTMDRPENNPMLAMSLMGMLAANRPQAQQAPAQHMDDRLGY